VVQSHVRKLNDPAPDAIHLAAAVVSGCDVFLTNDYRLNRFPDIAMDVIQP
jgi:predicted nucleic acid-binding protein